MNNMMRMHAEAIRECLKAAFGTKYSLTKLPDEELAALIGLQYALWWERDVAGFLLSDYADRSAEWGKKCRPAISEALKRLSGEDGRRKLPLYVDALFHIPTRLRAFSKNIEKVFAEYIDYFLGAKAHSEAEERTFLTVFARLRYLHRTFDHPEYEFTIGKEKAQAIMDRWLSTFDEHSGWSRLTLDECLARVGWMEEAEVAKALKADWRMTAQISTCYLEKTDSYPDREFCKAVATRAAECDKWELPHAEADFKRCLGLFMSDDLTARLLAARSIVEIFRALYLEEASALWEIPGSTRKRYMKVVESEDIAAFSEKELMEVSELALYTLNTLRSLEDDCGFFVENLKIAAVARQLCSELASRGEEKMLRLADKLGFADGKILQSKEDWALGGEETMDRIVDKALSVGDTDTRSDDELACLAGLLKTMHDSMEELGVDAASLEDAMEKCFSPLWTRCGEGQGNPLRQFEGIKAIFDCQPEGLGFAFHEQMEEFERTLAEALLNARDSRPGYGLRGLEVATSYPLRAVEGFGAFRKYKDTIGMDYYREEVGKWAGEIEAEGHWPGLSLEDAFRRIRILQNDYLRSVEGVDYEWVIATAFNRYSKQVIEVEPNTDDSTTGGSAEGIGMKLHPSSFDAIALMADCYFALVNRNITNIMPAHLIRYCASGPEEDLHGECCWLFYSIILRAQLLQNQILRFHPQFEPSLN